MLLKKIALIILTLTLLTPASAQANDIDIQAGSVRVTTSEDGAISVNTGNTNLKVPSNNRILSTPQGRSRIYTRQNQLRNRRIYRNGGYESINKNSSSVRNNQRVYCGKNGNYSNSQTTRVTGSGKRVVQSNVNTTCR